MSCDLLKRFCGNSTWFGDEWRGQLLSKTFYQCGPCIQQKVMVQSWDGRMGCVTPGCGARCHVPLEKMNALEHVYGKLYPQISQTSQSGVDNPSNNKAAFIPPLRVVKIHYLCLHTKLSILVQLLDQTAAWMNSSRQAELVKPRSATGEPPGAQMKRSFPSLLNLTLYWV